MQSPAFQYPPCAEQTSVTVTWTCLWWGGETDVQHVAVNDALVLHGLLALFL